MSWAIRAGTLLTLAACSGMPAGSLPGNLGTLVNLGGAAMPIGVETEREIGLGIAAIVAGRYPILDDAELTRYVTLVGRTVAEQSTRAGEIEFVFGVLDTDEVNAFAAPGGYILVTRGALAAMESEAELAAVLAHEIAHVDEKQVLNEIRRSNVFGAVRSEANLTGPILDQIAGAGAGLLFTGLSRGDELAADSIGLIYTAATGYRADALVGFLARLQQADTTAAGGRLAELRSTHPALADRIAALRRQAAATGTGAGAGVEARERFRRRVGSAGGG
jgi:beta-barrel assembly-enhancing protease